MLFKNYISNNIICYRKRIRQGKVLRIESWRALLLASSFFDSNPKEKAFPAVD